MEITDAWQVEVATVEEASVTRMFAVRVPFVEYIATTEVLVLPATGGSPDHTSAYGAVPPVEVAVHVTTLFATAPAHETESAALCAPTIEATAKTPKRAINAPPAIFALEIIIFVCLLTTFDLSPLYLNTRLLPECYGGLAGDCAA
jgi:hypothetical protein